MVALVALTGTLHAVVIRGTVTDTLGHPLPGVTVRLIQGQRAIASDISSADGAYEIRSSASGRFVLLAIAVQKAPRIGEGFYGSRTSVVERNIIVDAVLVQPPFPTAANGVPTSLAQTTASVAFIPADDLRARVGLLDELRLSPGTSVIQQGQVGSFAGLYMRGGGADANHILIDGVSAEDVGGRFDFGTVGNTALALSEIDRGPNSALYGTDAEAGVVSLATAQGSTLRPVFDYTGEAGSLHTWRDEATLSGTRTKLDYLLGYARLDTSNALRLNRYHSSTSVANLGYAALTNTLVRFTLRNADSASGLPGPYDLYGVSQSGRQGDQDLYSGLTVENRVGGNWHTVARYGIARKREQVFAYAPFGQSVTVGGFTTYYANAGELRGANGYKASGLVAIQGIGAYPGRQDAVSNRDELSVQSDYAISRHVTALLGLRYVNERGEFVAPAHAENEHLQRVNFDYTLGLQGDIVNRIFFSMAGSIEKNHLLGLRGNPRLGLAYFPVRPGSRWLRGTKIHTSAATGFREPSLLEEDNSLYNVLLRNGSAAWIAQYHVTPVDASRSRGFDFGVDQNILRQKLIFRATYFHSQFSHQIDDVNSGTLKTTFGLGSSTAPYDAYLSTLAYRAQGFETVIEYQPLQRLFLHGGYTYLSSVVERSFATPLTNPNLPGIAIGASSPLVGARPFRRPPHTGFAALQYTGKNFTGAIESSLASRSDDSTYQNNNDVNGGNTLLLPNRDLDFGYARLDASFTYAIVHHVTVFTQLENLLNQQHMAPIGFVSLPFTVRAGVKIRIGGD
jgi:vitamin B12 transporter